MSIDQRLCIALLGCALSGLTTHSVAATLAVVATDDGVVKFYRLSNNLGIMIPGKSVPVGKMPVGMCGDPNGTRLYVSEVPEKILAVIDVATQAVVATIEEPGMKRPADCVVGPDGKKLYLMDSLGNSAFVYDTASNKLLKTITVGEEPNHGIFSPDGKRLIVSNAKSNTLTVIDPTTDAVVKTVKTGTEPAYMTYTRDGKFLVVGLIDDDSIAFFNADTLEFDQQVGVPQSPQVLLPSADGQYLYVLGRWHGVVGLVNLRARGEHRRVVATIPVPKYPLAMTLSPDGKHLYVSTEHFENTLVHIDVDVLSPDYIISDIHHPGLMIYLK